MKKTVPKTKTLFVITALFALAAATCEKGQTAEATQTVQALQEAQDAETAQRANREAGEEPPDSPTEITGADETPAGKPMSASEAAKLVQPIKEIEMVFVEGGTMAIQWQEISLDSFYISRYVLNGWPWTEIHNWAYDNGYLDFRSHRWDTDQGEMALNARLGWIDAVLACNWLSIMEGLAPVYRKEGGTEPLTRDGDIMTAVTDQGELVSRQWYPFYVDWDADGYRLPTEAEWEFAARGGNESMGYMYAGSNVLSEVKTDYHALEMRYIPGQRKPNELGIHDMSGEASEWVLGPWTEAGELYPAHNPGRIPMFGFADPFYAVQKGGNDIVESEYARSIDGFTEGGTFRPGARIKANPLADYGAFEYYLTGASIRLVRTAK